jgi:hypothetical protein
MSNNELMSLKFENREEEIQDILDSTYSSVLVDAPAGYGKTVLLQEIQKRREALGWKCPLIDLGKHKGKDNIRKVITDYFQVPEINASNEQDANRQLRESSFGEYKVILLIDSLERGQPDDWRWLLNDFIPTCRRPDFRVVVASRYAIAKLANPDLKEAIDIPIMLNDYHKVPLKLLSAEVVEKVLKNTASNRNKEKPSSQLRKIEKQEYVSWSKHFMRLSGGHPRSIQKLVTELVKSKYNLVFPTDEERLLRDIIIPEVDRITEALADDRLKKALEVLSIFRKQHFGVAAAMQNTQLPKDLEFPKDINARTIIRELYKIGLITKDKDGAFYSDAIVRDLILVRMKVVSADTYREMNRIAKEYYDRRIEQKRDEVLSGHISDELFEPQELISIYVRESIYHYCQSYYTQPLPLPDLVDFIIEKLLMLISVLEPDESDPTHKVKLANRLATDKEIVLTIEEKGFTLLGIWREVSKKITSKESDGGNNNSTELSDRRNIQKQYQSIIVAIEDVSKKSIGTGFILEYGGRQYVVTCAHVLKSLNKGEGDLISLRHFDINHGELEATVRWFKPPSNVDSRHWNARQDVAVLELINKLPDLMPLRIEECSEECSSKRENCWCYGYLEGTIGDWVREISCEVRLADGFCKLLQSGRVKIKPGASGAPLCHVRESEGVIIGMIHGYKEGEETAYLIRSSVINEILSLLDKGV